MEAETGIFNRRLTKSTGAAQLTSSSQVRDLKASGVDSVLATAVYAILGSVALQKGGAVATETMRRKVLTPLGVL